MPNVFGKKINEIHGSVLNVGGSGVGLKSEVLLPVSDGNGINSGIEVSLNKLKINSRRGLLSNFVSDSTTFSKIKKEGNFPNAPLGSEVPDSAKILIIDLDKYCGVNLNITRNDFVPKVLLKSFYFESYGDGEEIAVGYWQRTFAGIENYFVSEEGESSPVLGLNQEEFMYDPDPSFVDSSGEIAIQGLIKLRTKKFTGIRHLPSILEFYVTISVDEEVEFKCLEFFDKITKYVPTDSSGNPYGSITTQVIYQNTAIVPFYVNFDKQDLITSKTIFKVILPNPSLYGMDFYPDPLEGCVSYGQEILPRLDWRFFTTFQSPLFIEFSPTGIGSLTPQAALIYKISS